MKGLDLSRQYFGEICSPMLKERFPGLLDRVAAGLVGEGSECFGFDDEISRDHDWGPGVCLWLCRSDYEHFGAELEREFERLPTSFGEYGPRQDSRRPGRRTGVFETGEFYFRYIGHDQVPQTSLEWLVIPEENLATATNGEVFSDPCGEFTRFRNVLLAFYPEDVRLKKIATRCVQIAQSGQYNFPRCVARREYVAARMAETEFINAASSMIFLLNRCYKPFYKWMHRAIQKLPILGNEAFVIVSELVNYNDSVDNQYQKKLDFIKLLSSKIVEEMINQKLTDVNSDFLLDHEQSVLNHIEDKPLTNIGVWI